MMRIAFFLLTFIATLAAEDSWAKVQRLKSGAELRIYTENAAQPLLGKMDEAREDSLIVVIKNKQVAIARERIERLDARPIESASRVTREKKDTADNNPNGPTTSTSSNLSFHSKPNFETIYTHKQ